MEEKNNQKSTFRTLNPATEKVEKTFNTLNKDQVNEVVEKAHEAFTKWKNTPFSERAQLLSRVAGLLDERKAELARLCSIEMGKIYSEGIEEVELCAGICTYYAENGEKILADEALETKTGQAFVCFEPLGVIFSIQPWNFPFYQIIRAAAPHIMAGNTFILKHSHNVPQCALAVEKIFKDAGAPDGVYTNIFISEEESADVIAHQYVRGITFTGSERAGSEIASNAGKALKKTVLELGGSDPFIILDDADMEEAVEMVVEERLSNAGQVCTSPKRIIIMEKVAEEFIRKVKEKVENIKVGDPQDEQTELGPLVSTDAMKKVLKQVSDSVEKGAKLVYGGKQLDRPGAFMEPTILTNITPETVAYKEEIFGPVICIYPVKDEQAAIDLANDSIYGLGGSILTKDEERGIRVARQIETGMVYINHVTATAPELPFGGVKNSGYGRELSKEGMKEFVNKKLIRVTSTDAPY